MCLQLVHYNANISMEYTYLGHELVPLSLSVWQQREHLSLSPELVTRESPPEHVPLQHRPCPQALTLACKVSTPLSLQSFIKLFSSFSCLNKMFYSFPSLSITLMLLAQPSWARICLNSMLMFGSTCFYACFHAYVLIYMFPCLFPCLCLDLCFYVLFVMLMPRSMLLCALFHAYAFMCSLSCLYLDLCLFRPYIIPMFGSTCLVDMPCVMQPVCP